jgi:hypothetical protein
VNELQWRKLGKRLRVIECKLGSIEDKLDRLNRALPRKRFDFAVGPVTNKQRKKITMEIKITNEQQVKVTLNPVTGGGKPVTLDGAPAWSVISGNSTVVPAEDGLSADLVSEDGFGDTEFLVKADADLGEGVVEISDTIRLTVVGAKAESLGLSAGEPTQK